MRKRKNFKALVILLLSICILQQPTVAFAQDASTQTNQQNDIDEGIFNLDYNKYEVLATNGDTIESFVPREGTKLKDKFIVIERKKRTLASSPVDISIIDSMSDRTYPGVLQLANNSFVENQPTVLTCKRKPINISIDLPGMKNENRILVENPTYANVSGSIDELISKWDEKYSSTHTLPARMQYSESMVYSKSQLETALNINSKVMNGSLAIDFNAIASGEKKVMVAAYKQIFYTVSAELPNNPSDLFDDSITFKDLTRRGVSKNSPPLMVSNVAYGRTIYVKLETTSKSKDVQEAFKALLNDNSAQQNAKYKDILNESSFTAVVLGGDSKEHNKIVSKNFDDIRNIIKNNAEFNTKNPAYPISYTSVFVKDNSVAAIHNKTDYIETTTTEYSKGRINVDHSGAYVAQFEIMWDEFNYDEKGNEIVEHKTWKENWNDQTAHFTSQIPLPANAKNINIYARECTGLAWEWWRVVLDEKNVPLTSEIDVSIGGTTLYPNGSITHR